MIKTTTQMRTIILTFFHQNFRATFCDVVLKCSDCWGIRQSEPAHPRTGTEAPLPYI